MLLVVGLVATSGGVGSLVVNSGNALVLGATMLWGIETVIIKRLLTGVDPGSLGVVRMGGGITVLAAYLAITGQLAALFHLDANALRWVVLTGLLLGAYVATWMIALSRARAVDVTSVLVSSRADHRGLTSRRPAQGPRRTVVGTRPRCRRHGDRHGGGEKKDGVRVISGAVLFARYVYPPNALGYCGPSDSLSLAGALEDREPHRSSRCSLGSSTGRGRTSISSPGATESRTRSIRASSMPTGSATTCSIEFRSRRC